MTAIESVRRKIEGLDLNEPYIWQLRITTDEFNALGKELHAMLKSDKDASLKRHPLLFMAYIAEWYKRCYTGDSSDSALPLSSGDLERLWGYSGIDIPTFVAVQTDGTRRWLYSIFVLGGLALQFEMQRGDEGRFMRKLCRLYHGEDTHGAGGYDTETNNAIESTTELSVSDQNALSFRQSIERRQSLFEYIRAIINGDFPFAEEDLTSTPLFKDFIKELTEANLIALAKADKFELIRGMWYAPGLNIGRRLLFLRMRPEETGKGYHGYLRYDRLRAWGAKDPDKIAWLAMSLRFFEKGRLIQDADFSDPIKEWEHTGWRESGMLCCGSLEIECRDVPCQAFDKVEAVIVASTGEEFIVGKWECAGYSQMWLKDEERMIWTDRRKQGTETMLFFSERWKPTTNVKTKEIRILTEEDAQSDLRMRSVALQSAVALTDGITTVGPFFPTQGNLELSLIRYEHLIMYSPDGSFKVMAEGEELSLPSIFYLSDIAVSNINQDGEQESMNPDKVEFLSGGKYKEWTRETTPDYGIQTLRISQGAKVWKIDVVYLQPIDDTNPIVRDLKSHTLRYVSNGKAEEIKDSISFEEEALDIVATIHCVIWFGTTAVTLPLYRPNTFRRWVMDFKYSGFISDDRFAVAWLLRERIRIDELSVNGYREYECKRLNKKLDLPGSLIHNWKDGSCVIARDMDEEAYDWLEINYGTPPPAKMPDIYVEWEIASGSRPTKKYISDISDVEGIAFKDASDCTTPEYGYPIWEDKEEEEDDFWGEDDTGTTAQTSPTALESFLIASEYQTYFALFPPFNDAEEINDSTINAALIEPLRSNDGGRITEAHLGGLRRLADEFGFNIDINALRK